MLAVGWGGTAQVESPSVIRGSAAFDFLDMPAFLNRPSSVVPQASMPSSKVEFIKSTEEKSDRITPEEFINRCHNAFSWSCLTRRFFFESLRNLMLADIPDRVLEELEAVEALSTFDNAEQQVVISFFVILLNSPVAGCFNAKEKQTIEKVYDDIVINSEIQNALEELFAELKHDSWGFSIEYSVSSI